MDGMTGEPPSLFWISKGVLTRTAYAKFCGILIVGYVLNEFKWILSFRCHCQLVEYPNMPLTVCVCVSANARIHGAGIIEGVGRFMNHSRIGNMYRPELYSQIKNRFVNTHHEIP